MIREERPASQLWLGTSAAHRDETRFTSHVIIHRYLRASCPRSPARASPSPQAGSSIATSEYDRPDPSNLRCEWRDSNALFGSQVILRTSPGRESGLRCT